MANDNGPTLVIERYNQFKNEFNDFKNSLASNADILERSTQYREDMADDVMNAITEIDKRSETLYKLISDRKGHMWTEGEIIVFGMEVNQLIKSHQNLYSYSRNLEKNLPISINLEENLPIAQAVWLYLSKAIDPLSNLCAAVTNLFTKILPEKASEAKPSFTSNLNKLRSSVQDLTVKAPKKSSPKGTMG